MSGKKFLEYAVVFTTPVAILTGITWFLQRDNSKDIEEYKKSNPALFKNNQENNEKIFKYILESSKGDRIDFMAGPNNTMNQIRDHSKSNSTTTPTNPEQNK
ncbi:hypothetical protein DLAC_06219 [Tieghemostelium lacteum]|uniref:Uncharacterized protein n=1 Tax=Tieghemostelium lacteum TaxID=361077 RepID=A0A151ZHP8_TIELA|nr:hypothetical protein DLAC_06219 [Tieghemostelium lacteum]|eukprot:KYQ93518.1 hypothetical protein DLAC_06219 [Tieghemostelium lacteum]